MTLAFAAFTRRGENLARRLAQQFGGSVTRIDKENPLPVWTAQQFLEKEGLVFVGAVGIAVRAVAPHLRHKTTDPAVVAVDEGGRFAIPWSAATWAEPTPWRRPLRPALARSL